MQPLDGSLPRDRYNPLVVQIVLFDGFDLLDALGPYEVFQAADLISDGGIKVALVSVEGARKVPSAPGGLPIEACGRPDLERADLILIPGAAGPVTGDAPESVPALLAREAAGDIPRFARLALAKSDVTIATVCGGSLILGMAGLLKGRPAVTHHMGMDMLATVGAVAVKARVVDDGNLVTGGGVTSGIDVALHLVERELGPRIAHAVEALFEHERRGTVWRAQGLAPTMFPGQPAPAEGAQTDRYIAPPKSDPTSVEGRWNATISTPLGKHSVIYDISIRDGVVMGTATQGGETRPLENPTLTGNRLTWAQHISKPMKLHLRFDVTVNQDAMSGTISAGVLPASRLEAYRLA
jgi:putative intracellular protease/amidase